MSKPQIPLIDRKGKHGCHRACQMEKLGTQHISEEKYGIRKTSPAS